MGKIILVFIFRRLDYENVPNEIPKKQSVAGISQDSSDIRPIQRPQPRKPPPGPGAIPPPPQQQLDENSGNLPGDT